MTKLLYLPYMKQANHTHIPLFQYFHFNMVKKGYHGYKVTINMHAQLTNETHIKEIQSDLFQKIRPR